MQAVRAFETHTSAELVVTVRKHARRWTEIDLACGGVVALLALVFLLFHPAEFSVALMPADVSLAFAAGFALSRWFAPLRRALAPRRARRTAVDDAAKIAFVDLGVSRTTGRTGVLVYVALFERLVGIVVDVGVSDEAKKAADEARDALEAALSRSDVRTFAEVLEALGPRFGATMERAADDVNELPDEVA